MNTFRWIVAMALVVGMVGGCQQPTMKEVKEKANNQWMLARAKMLYGVAQEHLKVGELDRARNKSMEALALAPEMVEARLLLTKVLIEQGFYKPAITEAEKVIAQLPKSSEAVYLLGVAQERDNQLAPALESYRKAFALDDTNFAALMAEGEVMVAMGRLDEARSHVESNLHLANDDPGMHELAGRIAMIQRRFSDAVMYFRVARDMDYKNPLYLEMLAKAEYYAGQYDDASRSLKTLTEIENRKAPVWAYTMLGDSYMALGRPRDARDAYHQAADRTPSNAECWINLAKAALQINDPARAVISARKAVELDPSSLEASLLLGYALIRDNKSQAAKDALTATVADHPKSAMAQCLLGQALARSGEPDRAAQCYRAALNLDPANVAAKELLAALGPQVSRVP